ncbi:MAG: C39 family peptidase [Chloroflexota bacterium]|nr:C39 family peptidase [Chloroflexota bacterium]
MSGQRRRSAGTGGRLTRRAVLLGGSVLAATGASRRAAALDGRFSLQRGDGPVLVGGRSYDAYVEAADKRGQFAYYSCEFDAAWIVLNTFGIDASFEEQVAITGIDRDPEPYAVETAGGIVIYGGDIEETFCGDFTWNYLAKLRSPAMRKVFDAYGLDVRPVRDRHDIQAALLRGEPVWVKPTVDFKPFTLATWTTLDGTTYPTVLDNDHAVVAVGFNDDVVVIKDPLGPTNTNWDRAWEYEVPWPDFLRCWEAQADDGLAVGPAVEGSGDGTEGPETFGSD